MNKLRVKTTPNARTSEVMGWEYDPMHGLILHVRIAAPPVEGKANAALRSFLANHFGLSRSQVILEKGPASRIKTFSLPGHVKLPE